MLFIGITYARIYSAASRDAVTNGSRQPTVGLLIQSQIYSVELCPGLRFASAIVFFGGLFTVP